MERDTVGQRRPWVLNVWARQPGLRHGYVLDLAMLVLLGVFTLVGGWNRVSGRAWSTMREFGGPYVWGTVLCVTAVALIVVPLVARGLAIMWTLWVAAVVYGLAAAWFFQASMETGTSLWGVVFSLYAAANQITRANAYREAR